jgi:hypothetical protein
MCDSDKEQNDKSPESLHSPAATPKTLVSGTKDFCDESYTSHQDEVKKTSLTAFEPLVQKPMNKVSSYSGPDELFQNK